MFSQIRAKHALASHALSSWLSREEAHESAVAQRRVAQQRQERQEEKEQQLQEQQKSSSSSLPPLQAKQEQHHKDSLSPRKSKASFKQSNSRPGSSSSSSSPPSPSPAFTSVEDMSPVPPPAGPAREAWEQVVHGVEAVSDVGMGGVGVFELPCAEIGPPVRLSKRNWLIFLQLHILTCRIAMAGQE